MIAIWCNHSAIVDQTSTDQRLNNKNPTLRTHWQTLLILPKNYISLEKIRLNNKSEVIFFKDSVQGSLVPDDFKHLLIQKQEISFITEGVSNLKVIGGLFNS